MEPPRGIEPRTYALRDPSSAAAGASTADSPCIFGVLSPHEPLRSKRFRVTFDVTPGLALPVRTRLVEGCDYPAVARHEGTQTSVQVSDLPGPGVSHRRARHSRRRRASGC
jgi:hypothetical protein